jgi:hypothetical protein
MLIPIIIPVGYQYSCVVSGSTFKIVQCEHCRFLYVYKMTRTGAGVVSASLLNSDPYVAQNAEKAASFNLTQKLQGDCDAVPCLECGKYQQHMVDALKRDFARGWWYTGWIALGAALVAGIIYLASFLYDLRDHDITLWLAGAAAVLAALGGLVLFLRRRLLQRYDPNSTDLAERMQLAARYGRSMEQFQEYLKQNGVDWRLPDGEAR